MGATKRRQFFRGQTPQRCAFLFGTLYDRRRVTVPLANIRSRSNPSADRIGAAGTESRVHLQIFARMLSRKGLIAVLSVRFRKPSDQLCSAVQCSACATTY